LLTFREIAGGTLVQGGAFPLEVPIAAFRIAETEVSHESWEAFLRANPQWGPEHTEILTAQGLVTEDYLLPAEQNESAAVSGVSWYAAQAYCQWLTSFLPPGLADYEVRLPTEAEWEYAAKASAVLENSASGLKDMVGGFWEWCMDPYAPNNFLPADPEIIAALGSPERSVRGNSWVNVLSTINEETRGSLFPSSCSPFGSFRPVIAKKEASQ
jgi:formylglycine-generating enzyme required for sulfatase activity